MRVCMSSRWRAFVVPFHDRWLSLQPVWPDEAIVDVLKLVGRRSNRSRGRWKYCFAESAKASLSL